MECMDIPPSQELITAKWVPFSTGRPDSMRVGWYLNFIRESMKIHKMTFKLSDSKTHNANTSRVIVFAIFFFFVKKCNLDRILFIFRSYILL